MKKKALTILLILLALVPIGILTDAPAWGEWDLEYYKEKLGFIPKGMEHSINLKPLIPDYEIDGIGTISGYYISAIVGVVLVFLIYFILLKVIKKKNA